MAESKTAGRSRGTASRKRAGGSTKTGSSRTKTGSSKTKAASGSAGKRSQAKRAASAGKKAGSAGTKRQPRKAPDQGSPQPEHVNGVDAARKAAAEGTKAAGRAVASAAKRARGPLVIAGGAAAGVAGGLALRRRRNGSGPRAKLPSGLGLPVKDGRLDADAVASLGRWMEGAGRQISTVAAALRAQQGKR